MNRQDEINKAATQILNERMQDNYLKVSSYYNDHKGSILSNFKQQIISLLNQAKNAARNMRKTANTICCGKFFTQ